MRRPQTRYAAALLVHHKHRAMRQDATQRRDQVPKLCRGLYVAGEQNDAEWRMRAEEPHLIG